MVFNSLNPQEALEDLNKAIELNPKNADSYFHRGAVSEVLKQYKSSLEDLNEAIRLKPNYAEAYNSRGKLKNRLEQYEEAVEDFN